MKNTHVALRNLVNSDKVHRSLYTDKDIFQLEMERLFGHVWLPLGHESQLAQAGSFFTARMGAEKVIVVRGEGGKISIFFNRCPHRGAVLVNQPAGCVARFQCPYHGWSFSNEGSLTSLPAPEEYPDFQGIMALGLRSVGAVRVYRGFIFGRIAESGDTLEEYLGDALSTIDNMVDRSPSGTLEALPGILRHEYRGNWKLQFENLNDAVHPGFAHAASIAGARAVMDTLNGASPSPEVMVMHANGKPMSFFRNSPLITLENGHSFIGGHIGEDETRAGAMGQYAAMLADLHGEERAKEILGVDRHVTLVYPSSTWHARFQTLKLVIPIAPDLTHTQTMVFRMPGAPPELLRMSLAYANMANSPASPIIADDLDIYESFHDSSGDGGPEWLTISRGTGQDIAVGPGVYRSPGTSESYIRNQFTAWMKFMENPTHA